MEALKLLLGTPIGWLSLLTIVFIIGMAAWLVRFFARKMDEDARAGGK